MTNQYTVNASLEEFLKQFVLAFVNKNLDNESIFSPNRLKRRFCKLDDHQELLPFDLSTLVSNVYSSIGLSNIQAEPVLGTFIGVNEESAAVNPHKDSAPPGKFHVRVNFMISKPIEGGDPIINGVTNPVEENQAWIIIANLWNHASTAVVGEKKRIILSVGALVDEQEFRDKFPGFFEL